MYEVQLTSRFAGYSLGYAQGGDELQVEYRGVTSVEDGDRHIRYLEGLPQIILSMLPVKLKASVVETLVVIISHDLKAKVYINELDITYSAIPKARKIEKGQGLTRDDISGIDSINFGGGFSLPDDHAYFCILPIGWDQAYFFDFSPLNDQKTIKIKYDVEKYIGSYVSYLMFKKLHKIEEIEWKTIIDQKWFPFSALRFSTIETIINYAKAGWIIDGLIEEIDSDTLSFLDTWIVEWKNNEGVSSFIEFLDSAVKRHKAGDYVSSISTLYPTIEGLLRSDFIKKYPDKEGRQQNVLMNHVTEKTIKAIPALTSYLPRKFRNYLEKCYFKDFYAGSLDNEISRHSVSHGASSIEKYTKKYSLLGLLVFSQIAQYLVISNKKVDNTK